MKIPNILGKQEMIDPAVVEKYGHLLSAKTQAALALDAQKRDLAAKENRKAQLIEAISSASQQIDLTEDESAKLQSEIATAERELSEIEKSLSAEAKRVYKLAESVLNNRLDLCQKYNQALRDAESLWQQINADLTQAEAIAFSSAFNAKHPIADLNSFIHNDVNFEALPEFIHHPDLKTVSTHLRNDRRPDAL